MRKALSGAAVVLFVWGVIVAVTGGIDARVLGVVIRSRDPVRALAAGFLLVVIQAVFFRQELIRDIDRGVAIVRRAAAVLAVLLAVGVGGYGVAFGTFSVGASDAYGYVNQAYDWYEGALPGPIPLAERLPFEASDRMQAPLGYREGRQPQTIVPTYAPGLPLLMALALAAAGACGPFLVVPASAAVFVWLTFRLGRRAAGDLTGLLAAFALAVSPVFLFQTAWPMSDVPAGAVWTAALGAALGSRTRDAALAGLLTALGLLIRPNLLPVAAVLALPLAMPGPTRSRITRLVLFAVPIGCVGLFTGWLNALWFGSPLNSGYGAAGELYGWSNVLPNLRLNAAWMWQSQTPLMLAALLPILPRVRRALDTRVLATCAALFVATLACYVSYAQFEVWWYLRFLLPAFGALMVLVAVGFATVARAIPKPYGMLAGVVVLGMFAVTTLTFSAREGVFGGVRDSERRYEAIGSFAATLPDDAALIAVQHAGSLRFHTGRRTIRFDVLEYPRSLQLPAALERAGLHPYLVIDDAEMPDVRTRFGIPADAPLPWPILARMRELGGVTVYDLGTSPAAAGPVALEPTSPGWCDAQPRAALRH